VIVMQPADLAEFLKIRRSLSRRSFWQYCITVDQEFYKPDRKHLQLLCETLQNFHEGKIVRKGDEPWRLIEPDEPLGDLEVCRKLIINMPPRFGKTRTLVLFEAWLLGKNKHTKFVTASYNDDAASDISRYVRDTISQKRQQQYELVYGDIFPDTKIKSNDKSVQRWAVEGSFFSYIGTGPGGTVTGKGADYLVVDDPVKNAETAFNAVAMKKINSWIMNTLLSRMEAGCRQVIVHTRWPNGDATSAFMDSSEKDKYYQLVLRAESQYGELLCEEILNREDYDFKKSMMDPTIFQANYNQSIIRPVGALYKEFKTYEKVPEEFERAICFIDTADQGDDFLCAVIGVVKGGFGYVTDVVYTQGPVEESQPMVCEALFVNQTKEVMVESNSGGRSYAKDIDSSMIKDYQYPVSVEDFFQTANKETRIISNAAAVMQRVLFPEDWMDRFPEYALAMTQHLRIGKNLHDDAPDATTGFYEFAFNGGIVLV